MTIYNALYKHIAGTLANPDEVNSNYSFILNNLLNFALDGATITNQNHLVCDLLNSTSRISSSSTVSWDGSLDYVFSGYTYDDYEDSSLDTNKWTVTSGGSPTNTETAGTNIDIASEGYIRSTLASTGYIFITASGATTTANLKPQTGSDSECIVYVDMQSSVGGSAGANQDIYLIDESGNSVTLKSAIGGSSSSLQGMLRLVCRSGSNCDIYWNSTAIDSTVSTAPLVGTKWYLKFRSSVGSSTPASIDIKIKKLRYANAGVTVPACDLISSTTTVPTSETVIHSSVEGTGTYTHNHSFNSGSNYTEITNHVLSTVANAGTGSILKITTPTGALSYLPKVYSFAYYYD